MESSYLTFLFVMTKFQDIWWPPYVLSGTLEIQIFDRVEEADARSIGAISAILRAAKNNIAVLMGLEVRLLN